MASFLRRIGFGHFTPQRAKIVVGGGGGGAIALKADFANTATTEAWMFW